MTPSKYKKLKKIQSDLEALLYKSGKKDFDLTWQEFQIIQMISNAILMVAFKTEAEFRQKKLTEKDIDGIFGYDSEEHRLAAQQRMPKPFKLQNLIDNNLKLLPPDFES